MYICLIPLVTSEEESFFLSKVHACPLPKLWILSSSLPWVLRRISYHLSILHSMLLSLLLAPSPSHCPWTFQYALITRGKRFPPRHLFSLFCSKTSHVNRDVCYPLPTPTLHQPNALCLPHLPLLSRLLLSRSPVPPRLLGSMDALQGFTCLNSQWHLMLSAVPLPSRLSLGFLRISRFLKLLLSSLFTSYPSPTPHITHPPTGFHRPQSLVPYLSFHFFMPCSLSHLPPFLPI